ncbi:unnamed protein product [Candidula unifasciata]|uniref:Uncharacterized protein n=1 Tax=Candidula unifasciata TaxID=100452 RepID=A0A8S3ZNQ8_9EUPU|nr:unnamed protein product [Candidula unifasciata]
MQAQTHYGNFIITMQGGVFTIYWTKCCIAESKNCQSYPRRHLLCTTDPK